MSDLRERILNIMSTVFEIDPAKISEDDGPGVIENWDSLKHMTLVIALEEEFGVRFRDELIEQLLSLKLIEVILQESFDKKTA